MNNLVLRSITGIVFVLVLVSATLFHSISFFVLYLTISTLSLFEFYSITKSENTKPNFVLGIVSNVVIQSLAFAYAMKLIPVQIFSILLPIVLILFIIDLYRKHTLPFNGLAYTFTGLLYVSIPFSLVYSIALSTIEDTFSPELIIALLVMVWTNDTGAYLSGMSMGRTKLFERISPKKTWEGAIGGTLLVLAVSYFIGTQIEIISITNWLVLGFFVSVFANFGDLVESMLKRSLGVKDSGKLLPGHGGMLDRFDGVIFAIPAFFTYLQLVNL